EVQRVALVEVEKEISRRRVRRSADECAVNAAAGKRRLIRVGEIELGAIAHTRGTKSQLPSIDSRALHVDREEDVGIVQAVVIEKVGGASQKVVGIQDPAFEWNSDSELMLFVTLTSQGHEIKPLLDLNIV